jgi:ABC-type glycerol-3-phosphate transport system substrate-binding protein
MSDKNTGSLARRAALGSLALAAIPPLARAQALTPAPAVRKKVTLSYWTWSDNPQHQKLVTDAVDRFNK